MRKHRVLAGKRLLGADGCQVDWDYCGCDGICDRVLMVMVVCVGGLEVFVFQYTYACTKTHTLHCATVPLCVAGLQLLQIISYCKL